MYLNKLNIISKLRLLQLTAGTGIGTGTMSGLFVLKLSFFDTKFRMFLLISLKILTYGQTFLLVSVDIPCHCQGTIFKLT